MAKKRKDDGHRETQSGDNKKRKGTYAQKGQLSGPGILLTTVRRKERKAGLELIEFLDDLVLDLYPDLDLSIPEPRTHISEVPLDDDDDLDALKNGTPPVAISSKDVLPDIPAIKAPKSSIEDDIEAQLQAELDELRPKKHKEHRNGSQTNADRSTTATTTSRKAFTLIDPEVECLMFVSVAWPMDPVKLSCALLDRVAKTGQVRGHFIQRLSPIYLTGRADGMDKIEKLAAEVMEKHYPSSTDPLSYKVEVKTRLHNQLHKMDIIKAVASTVPAPHQADLSKPDLIINVEVLKMTVGLGILPRFEEYKRYNPQMIAQKYNQDHNNADGLASRTFLSSHPITPSVNQVE